MRLDNTAEGEVRFDPASLSLFAADTREFPAPIAQPAEPMVLEPGDIGTVDASFPLPGDRIPGTMDLGGLAVRWELEIDGRPGRGSATFARREIEVRYRDPGPRLHMGFGVGHHRRIR